MTDKITTEDVLDLTADSTALILTLMQQNARDAAFTTEALMHAYKSDADKLRAELAAIRWGIQYLFKDGFQPTESRIFSALWPDADLIADFLRTDSHANRD